MRNFQAAALGGLAVGLFVAYGCRSGGNSGGGSLSVASTTSQSSSASVSSTATATPATSLQKFEYIEDATSDVMPATAIMTLLDQTLGAAGVTSGGPASLLPIRKGYYVTATPQGGNVILRFDSDAAGVRPISPYVEVAVSNDLAGTFVQLVQTAMATAALTAQTPGLAAPWNLYLQAQSATGGNLTVNVAGDAQANFTISWTLDTPSRGINGWSAPSAFDPSGLSTATESVGGVVHFPIDLPTFQFFVNQAYGYNAPQRFNDFPLTPHMWLHLTVTADATGQVVNVHFDAIATNGARLYVAEAPASTDVGGRFFDETCARMREMTAEEALQPGSSKPWGTSFYYSDVSKGVVDVVVKGTKGSFDIAYAVQTPVFTVTP
ncbi:MAG TPA: hypothetical protein VFF73_41410 [Planctomycetota bacterium]|nr:hypothetical protein [Planctomycetota bacterium]